MMMMSRSALSPRIAETALGPRADRLPVCEAVWNSLATPCRLAAWVPVADCAAALRFEAMAQSAV